MQIMVPDISADGRRFVLLPNPPSDPPTFIDVANSLRFSNNLLYQYEKLGGGGASAEDVVKGAIYKEKLLATQTGAQPPWFVVAMDQILQPIRNDIQTGFANVQTNLDAIQTNFANVQTSLDAIQTRLTAVEEKLQQLTVKQAQVQRYTAKAYNLQQGIGQEIVYQIVPFPDNSDPTQPPHNLPPLTSHAAITGLSTPNRNRYYRNYTGTPAAVLPAVQRQTKDILLAVGISVLEVE